MDIKTEIKRCREQTGKSRRSVSLALGFEESYLQKIEMGKMEPSLSALRKMAKFFSENGCPFHHSLEVVLGIHSPALEHAG